MYEQRMNYNNTIDSCKKVSWMLAEAFAEYLHLDSAQKILTYKTGIYSDLQLPEKKLPLIIYAAGMNGSSWENIILFDSLVKAGYVVAAISSVGLFPGYMSEPSDLDEQVKDILYTKQKMKQFSFIDTANIGLLSWSLGGSAITKAAMISNDVKCLLSFDGTEIHYYGSDTAWDGQFNQIKKIAPYNPSAIRIPYMYLSSEHPKNIDSIYLFPRHIDSKEKYFVQFDNAIHENFSSIVSVVKNVAPALGNIDSSRHQIICSLALTYFNQYLKQSKKQTAQFIEQLEATKPGFITTAYPAKAN
jgi:predicted dienelactone hydrolase